MNENFPKYDEEPFYYGVKMCGINKYLTTHLARKSFSVSVMLANGLNIGVLSKTLGHSSIQVTLDSYADIINELVIKDINMVRKKLKSRKK